MRNQLTRSRRPFTRILPRRLPELAALPALLGMLVLAACGATTSAGPGAGGTPTSAPAYNPSAGHVLIRLYRTPGNRFPPLNAVPEWTLFGDGTLIYSDLTAARQSATNPYGLLQAHLGADQVSHILAVVVNQDAFFASTRDTYGTLMPDVGTTQFTVNAAGKSKTVTLLPQEGASPDQQTANVFAAQTYLLGYQATGAAPYVAPGVALLAYQGGAGATAGSQNARAWPYNDVSLNAALGHSCTLLQLGASCPNPTGGSPALTAVYGAEAQDILRFVSPDVPVPHGVPAYVSQGGVVYSMLVYPLLPDAMHPDSGAPALDLMTASGAQRVPLVAAQPA